MKNNSRLEEAFDLELISELRFRIHRIRGWAPVHYIDSLDPISRHWIAFADGEPVGCGTLAVQMKEVAGVECTHRLRWLGVIPEYRGRGIGTELILKRLEEAHADGAEYAWSSSLLHRVPMYVRLGAIADEEVYEDDNDTPHRNVRYGPLGALLG